MLTVAEGNCQHFKRIALYLISLLRFSLHIYSVNVLFIRSKVIILPSYISHIKSKCVSVRLSIVSFVTENGFAQLFLRGVMT